MLTLSVSVALTVLVPLAAKGYVKRDEAIPYIMGANITTLADTLVVAMLQPTPVAAQIVLAEAIGVTIVSLIILAFFFQPVKRSGDRAGRLARVQQPAARGVRRRAVHPARHVHALRAGRTRRRVGLTVAYLGTR